MRWIRIFALLLAVLLWKTNTFAAPPLILREPTLSRDAIVFVFAGDLWRVPRQGGDAVRLTSFPGQERLPAFSPDGSQIAFTAEFDGNVDVYAMPAAGGTPLRLTSHPADDEVVGWTPDGKNVLFSSDRASPTFGSRLYTVPAVGGPATELPLPIAIRGSFSPDGSRLAYVPTPQWQKEWKRYHGGQTRRIWLAKLADSSIEKLPHGDASEFNPMWIGDTVYFLSDREGPVTLFAYDLKKKKIRRCFKNTGLDIKSASAGPGAIVFSQFDAIRLYDLASGKVTTVDVRLTGDFAEVQPRSKKVASSDLLHGSLSPDGQRAVFETRGEIVTVPVGKGNPRNLTQTSGVAERDPAWSPDGKWIAYFSDESGEYELHLQRPNGRGDVRKFKLGASPSFYYYPLWSPDSRHIAYADKRGNLWVLKVEDGTSTLVDTQPFLVNFGPDPGPNSWNPDPDPGAYSWSPGSRWLTYTLLLKNHLSAVFIYDLETGRRHQVTDGMSDAATPKFSDSGRYLYFAASTDSGASSDLAVSGIPVATYSLYLVALDATETDDEKNDANKPLPHTDIKIDFDNIGRRIFALPVPARNYQGLFAGKSDTLFALENPPSYTSVETSDDEGPPACVVWKFDFATRKEEQFADDVTVFALAADLDHILLRKGDNWFVAGTDEPPGDNAGRLHLNGFKLAIDPRAEWRQMYHEAWRIERDFFSDPGLHGLNVKAAEARYEVYLDGLASRADLNFLFGEMLGELSSGHIYISGGDMPEVKTVAVGLLGADYSIEHNRYRFSRIYTREHWNPELRAPLDGPGLHVSVGEYLLAVNGHDVPGTTELYSFFQDKADKLVTLRVGPNSDGTGAREIKVKPVDSEFALRNRAWVEDNRRMVDLLSSNRLAYIYLPDTDVSGYTAFNRYYFAQIEKQGFIIDERFNAGGSFSDYWVDRLNRKPLINMANREGAHYSLPLSANDGPKVMLINEFAGSGGDVLPWFFHKLNLGPLVGRRTWGDVGDLVNHPLLDGSRLPAPDMCLYGTDGKWEVENHGVEPDYEVELDPKAWRIGRDLQLEKAVQVALRSLAKNPPKTFKHPPYPNHDPK